jgi:hypothetical protein
MGFGQPHGAIHLHLRACCASPWILPALPRFPRSETVRVRLLVLARPAARGQWWNVLTGRLTRCNHACQPGPDSR